MQILLGTPDALTMEVIGPKAREIIDTVDNELVGGSRVEKLSWSIAPVCPVGMPFKPFKEGTQFVDNGQCGFVFTYASHQEARFDEILEIAKRLQLWAKTFGDRVFTIKMVPPFQKDDPTENTIRRRPY